MYSMYIFFSFLFKQKTAYEMRISDWSSDVCSSDLFNPALSFRRCRLDGQEFLLGCIGGGLRVDQDDCPAEQGLILHRQAAGASLHRMTQEQIGRAGCRERVGQDV